MSSRFIGLHSRLGNEFVAEGDDGKADGALDESAAAFGRAASGRLHVLRVAVHREDGGEAMGSMMSRW